MVNLFLNGREPGMLIVLEQTEIGNSAEFSEHPITKIEHFTNFGMRKN